MITKQHIKAMAHINRFNGWTTRPYSVLEHTVIGTIHAMRTGEPEWVGRAFMLHDLHETEFGDIIRPVRYKYMNGAFATDVTEWDRRVAEWVGMKNADLYHKRVTVLDDDMLAAEIEAVATITDPEHMFDPIRHRDIATMITNETWRGNLAIDTFEHLWFGLFPNVELKP